MIAARSCLPLRNAPANQESAVKRKQVTKRNAEAYGSIHFNIAVCATNSKGANVALRNAVSEQFSCYTFMPVLRHNVKIFKYAAAIIIEGRKSAGNRTARYQPIVLDAPKKSDGAVFDGPIQAIKLCVRRRFFPDCALVSRMQLFQFCKVIRCDLYKIHNPSPFVSPDLSAS